MKWRELKPGDVLIDEEDFGNDYILVEKQGDRGRWLHVLTGVVTKQENINSDIDNVLECFTIIRGRKILQRGME